MPSRPALPLDVEGIHVRPEFACLGEQGSGVLTLKGSRGAADAWLGRRERVSGALRLLRSSRAHTWWRSLRGAVGGPELHPRLTSRGGHAEAT